MNQDASIAFNKKLVRSFTTPLKLLLLFTRYEMAIIQCKPIIIIQSPILILTENCYVSISISFHLSCECDITSITDNYLSSGEILKVPSERFAQP